MLVRLRHYPPLLALLAQLGATLLIGALIYLNAQLGPWRPTWLAAGLAQGLLAMLLAGALGLTRGWRLVNLLFVPALLLAGGANLPSWLFLLCFALLLLLNWNSFGERVPLYLTATRTAGQLVELLKAQPANFRFIDLGCGPAGLLLHLAKAYPQAQFVGVETAPLSFALAWLRALGQGNCQIHYRSLWRTDLASFSVVYCFLSPAPMPALWRKACEEMPVGTWLISNSFAVPGHTPDQQIALGDWRASSLLLWRMPCNATAAAGAPSTNIIG
ncbi:class I SAM-dependent methyltransferase [Pseudomonas sp. 5P_3.1_Bac2]|uniref:class I SAM-dependent methyltransferase n=1 Tax=Pseudomonas sp. 5P_3.1_Bac2 TaxID=2971617 RepID=UPI0021C7833F|nr:class I SAM-dependent methyltransferase [Pseudomonas sp. 5P_3.1_Bac2]MCU1718298.1 class I SAM-dependent methyltransferase [Pseudomonas sp. 5P_3.1_Bac2]